MNLNTIKNNNIREELFYGTHESGLKVYCIPNKFEKKYAALAVNYGSIDSQFDTPDGESICVPDGIAHFLEHKLFEKSDGTNAFDDYAKTGASANAYTSFNLTSYLFTCINNFYDNLDILCDMVTNPYFTDENVSKEQGIIGQEIKMYEDDVNWEVFFNMLQAMYVNHPVRKDIAGDIESISRIDKETLYRCYNSFYVPSNMILFVSGEVNFDKLFSIVDRYFPAGKSLIKPPARVCIDEPSNVHSDFIEKKLSISAPIFALGFKDNEKSLGGEGLLKKDVLTQMALEILFGRSSKTYTKLYDSGLINNTFYTDYTMEYDYAFAMISGESGDYQKVVDTCLSAIDSFEFTDEDFSLAKNVLIGRFLRMFNSVEYIGNTFVSNIFRDLDIFNYIEICRNVSPSEVRKRAESLMVNRNMALSVVNPI